MAVSPIRAGFAPELRRRGKSGSAGRQAAAEMQAIIRRYSQIIQRLKLNTPEHLREAMYPVFDKSQEYVPVATGMLRASGELESGRISANRFGAWITYGSPAVRYAAIVHERVDIPHDPPTSAKYLQRAMEEELDAFLVNLATMYMDDLR